ncbi:glucan endo-1,3-beta-D-glucosidase [Trichodelitschia bisporula]|uniref:Glucan endo-1,3-beta-D-glucosidase n=1 Tax=Trichodelitschia bisporula TaxID=703511 RepID=A0A6G1I861_9PEZI|nr:glucan endo-1,3-beta-D-glucosidase [Trichodelitschia bisporula]
MASTYEDPSGMNPENNVGPAPQTASSGDRSSWPEANTSSISVGMNNPANQYFRSRRLRKGTANEKPWLKEKDSREIWITLIPLIGLLCGLGIAAALVWSGYKSVTNLEYCLVLDEDWSHGIRSNVWTREAEVGGFGNGQFDMTTMAEENSFIKDGALHIKPTLQDAELVKHNSVINYTAQGICASDKWYNCVTSTNTTNGTIVSPAKSARMSTRKSVSIKYGRVEVEAKLPSGDWLWPAIWMLPRDSVYGEWPQSGEIDIAESRGNNWTYEGGGNDYVGSTLHWGPSTEHDQWWRSHDKKRALHTTFSDKFHTFGLEWSDKYMFTYIDSRLMQVFFTHLDTPFWQRGQFPLTGSNGTRYLDPWSQTGNPSTPFDKEFYLILNVAVGGTNAWFKDGKSGKPWVDGSPSARLDFWNAQDKWYPTWDENAAMVVKHVRMWQQKGFNDCM